MHHREARPTVALKISGGLKKLENEGYDLVEELQKELDTLLDEHKIERSKLTARGKSLAAWSWEGFSSQRAHGKRSESRKLGSRKEASARR
jgi:hypothetical protein